jgi:hypothetical protein
MLNRDSPGVEFIIHEKELRVYKELIDNRTEYRFDLYENRGVDFALDEKLNRNDLFFVTHAALAFAQGSTADPLAATLPIANSQLYTFGNPAVFDQNGDGTNGVTSGEAIEGVYQAGFFTLKTDPLERVKDLACTVFRYQQIESGDGSSLGPPTFGGSLEQQGFKRLSPNVALDGSENNNITITVRQGADLQNISGTQNNEEATDLQNYIVARLYGFIVLQGAQKIRRFIP